MRILVKSLGFDPGQALVGHVARKVKAALSHWAGRVGRVVVRIMDINGPRGGVDKTCMIRLHAPHHPPVVVTAITSDFYSAVDQAAHRADRAASRLFGRRPY